ncbi:adenylate kinase isoenzyme 1 isoform X2 [Tribolium castaneum]|uniref:adenylate kinase n=1 Tax=Tribolium castaneum TaxID=7070 RepID=D6WJX7_TRICA|nr:PREDICTED: adenylate kinase isoenzyme 1 isoform X2 [Tribolium castaneum]EFA03917.1 Adenylate kinase isoenzyme 1-like Protein [Tribolium castaneum]|eukprot:XP_008193137.1 PREDICTED: adenylate kinase isoenzyme 1 isoform X2 [Tribolium castaneum]
MGPKTAPTPEIKVPIIWVLGGPGSGKGTQCEKIVAKYGFTHLSSGDLLRNEVASGSPRGKELTAIMERGELVPMEVVLDLLKEAILKCLPSSKGFLIDGYPREKEQGIMFEQKIAPVNIVLFFDASEQTLVDRLLGRAKTSGRVDDNEETIKKRLHTFNTHNDQVVQQYTAKLKKINAERGADEIFTEVQTYLDPLVK